MFETYQNQEAQTIKPTNDIFLFHSDAVDFAINHKIIAEEVSCSNPLCTAGMKIINSRSRNYPDGRAYNCLNKQCNRKRSLKYGSKFKGIELEIRKILRIIYCFIFNYKLYQAIEYCDVSENTYTKVKDKLISIISKSNCLSTKIGGRGMTIQVDETAVCNGKIITDPSNEIDFLPGIQWLIGGVLTTNSSIFFLRLVPNRRKETILGVFRECVEEGTTIITDGYPSYPWAVLQFGSDHLIVNHTEGFVTDDGVHTNRIENFWSHFKQDYRSRSGVNKRRMESLITEFSFRKKYIFSEVRRSRYDAFWKILTIIDVND